MKKKKSCKGKNLAKDPQAKPVGRPVEYSPEFVQQARVLAENGASNEAMAKAFGVTRQTICNWRNDHAEFAAAIKDGREALDTGDIQRSMIQRAKGYTQVKVTKELQTVGPKMPALSTPKAELLRLATKYKLKTTGNMKKGEVYSLIAEYVEKHTREKLIIVKREETPMLGDVAAAKYVLPNIGPADKPKWKDKVEIGGQVAVTGMEEILKAIDGQSKGLPQPIGGPTG